MDVAAQIGAVRRAVRTEDRDGEEVMVVVASQTYDADVADVWDALTSAERIPRWFLPVTGDFRLGGRYQLEGNAGGEIRECEPPRKLSVTWEMGGGLSWVDVSLVAGGAAVDPASAEAWAASAEGREFMTLSSEAWGEASVAAGRDEAAARASTDRTTAFYVPPVPADVA